MFLNERSLIIKIDEKNRIIGFRFVTIAPMDENNWKRIPFDADVLKKFSGKNSLVTKIGAFKYKYVDDKVVDRTQEEIAIDEEVILNTPTHDDMIEAQVMYTAMMTNTLM